MTALHDQPHILREGEHSLEDLRALREQVRIWEERDIYELQLRELFEITHPALISSKEFRIRQEEFIKERVRNGEQELRGTWVYFPWNGLLIHTVSEKEYGVIRTNRNRNLVTLEEQEKLRAACVGLVGLSVGSGVAATLAYHGIGQKMKLAEFDTLETSNLNRMRGAFHQIGMKKINLVSRQLYEIDPYLDLSRFPEKMTKDTLREFFAAEPRPRVVFEIIDSFETKIHLRALAREYRAAVIMVTNIGDRVIMDVERYDTEPDIEYFNGRAGKVPQDMLDRPDTTDELKHRYAVALAGPEHIPQRALDSVKEIGKTLVGRPQLASTVTIAGGLGAYLTRKILLGENLPSRSWLIDLDTIFADKNAL